LVHRVDPRIIAPPRSDAGEIVPSLLKKSWTVEAAQSKTTHLRQQSNIKSAASLLQLHQFPAVSTSWHFASGSNP
jgi:hypothetical protein